MTRPLGTLPVMVDRAMADLDPDRTARAILQEPLSLGGELSIWQGKVVAFDLAAQTADVTLGGLPTPVEGVAHNSNYRPHVNDVVWVFQLGDTDFLILDRVGPFGPSIGSGAAAASVAATQTRSSTSYGDLATPGPSVQIPVSPSGLVLVQVSCWGEITLDGSAPEGGAMGISLSGANTWSPADNEASIIFGDIASGAAVAANTAVGASMVSLIYGLVPGITTVSAKYRALAGTATFYNRRLWALPL